MQAVKYAALALVSGPFVLTGILMTVKGLRKGALVFALAGLLLVTTMGASALIAFDNIDRSDVDQIRVRLAGGVPVVPSKGVGRDQK